MRFRKSKQPQDGRDTGTVALSVDINNDLDKVWTEAIEKFQHITNIDLPPGDSSKFVEIRNKMYETINQGRSKNKTLAIQVLDKSMILLQTFGNILSSTTSTVFPATGQCWSAISMVVGAAQSFSRILDGFVTLLERCLAFLGELCFFLKKKQDGETYLDTHIREPAYEILALFLKVVASSYKLSTSKCEKLKVFLDVFLFNDDAGLAGYLNDFEEKVRQLTNRKVDVILQDVKGLAKYMAASDEERNRHLDEINDSLHRTVEAVGRLEDVAQDIRLNQDRELQNQERRANLELIRSKLHIGEDQRPWKEQQFKIGSNRAPNTGMWLMRGHSVFRRWANVREKAVATITLTGKSGFGKSFLCSHVISHLLDTYSTFNQDDQPDRVYIAYYFRGNDRQMSLESCLRSLVYQLAAEDAKFCAEMAKALQKCGEIPQVGELWKLMVSGPLKTLRHRTYFLCIDGYRSSEEDGRDDEALAEIIRSVMSNEHKVTLRLFISTELEDLAKIPFDDTSRPPDITLGLPQKASKAQLHGIRMDETTLDGRLPNQDDLIGVARFRIDTMCRTKPDLRNLLDGMGLDVPERLAMAARGYYANLDSRLRQINACESEERVKDIINRADDDMETTVKESIIALDTSLTESDIDHLNEMLVWVIGGCCPIHLDLLQPALFIALGQNFMLRTLIDLKYSTLLKIDANGFVILQSDDLEDILQATGTPRTEAASSPNKSLLHTSEIELVDRFVKNICGDDLYNRFDFSVFFNVKRGKKETSIGVGNQNSLNIQILHRCLTALSSKEDDPRLATLREYAASHWFEHLKAIKDFSEADTGLLREIRSGLVAVLSHPRSIKTWWDPIRWESQRELGSDSEFIDVLMEVLKIEDIASGYSETADAEWVRSVTTKDGTRQHIFYHLALSLAHSWFSLGYHLDEGFSPGLFIISYEMMKDEFKFDPSLAEIDNMRVFMLWARERIGSEIDEPRWKYAEGCTLQCLNFNDSDEFLEAALDAFRAAQDLIPDIHNLWPIPGYMAEAHFERKEYKEALENNVTCRELKSGVIGTGRAVLEEQNYLSEYCHSHLLDADCHKELGDLEAAATSYQHVIRGDIFRDDSRDQDMHAVAAEGLFDLWDDEEKHASILEMMQAWSQVEDGTNDIKYWLLKMGPNEDFHSFVCSAAIKTGQHEQVTRIYLQAIEQATDAPDDVKNLNDLYHYYASILYYASPNQDDHDIAIDAWKDLTSTLRVIEGSIGTIELDALPALVKRLLCKALLDKAVSETAGDSSRGEMKYTSQLRTVVTDEQYIFPQLQNTPQDPRIALTRLLIMQGESEEAHSVAESMLRDIFGNWPDSKFEAQQYQLGLSHLLSAMDDDENAIAAWNMEFQPGTGESCSECESDVASFVCKQCLALYLCTDCHSDLLSDDLAPEMCNKKHSFLEIPKYDSSEEEESEDGMIKVEGCVVAQKDWLEGLRAQWNVTEEQLARRKAEEEAEARASEIIGRRVSQWWKKSRT